MNDIHVVVRGLIAVALVAATATTTAAIDPVSSVAVSPSPAVPAAFSERPAPRAGTPLTGDLIAPGRLVICTSFPRQRFAELDAEDRPFGIDVEIGQAIALAMGLESEVRAVLFEDLIDAVEDRECDAIVAGHFITSDRLERIEMTAYRQGVPNVIVRAGDPLAKGELTALCGRTFAVVAGTVFVDIVRGLGDYEGAGLDDGCRRTGQPVVDLREYPTQLEAEAALEAGEADAYAGNDFIAGDRPDVFELGSELPLTRNGIGTRKGADALLTALRAALDSIIDDGTYLDILERYGVAGVAVTTDP